MYTKIISQDHPKIKMLSLFIRPHVILNLYDLQSQKKNNTGEQTTP